MKTPTPLALLLLLAPPAHAGEPPPSSPPAPAITPQGDADMDHDISYAHFRKGAEFYDQKDYAKALVEFEASFAARPKAELLYNIAQCHEHLGQREDALRAYRAYLESEPAIAEDANRARRRVGELTELIEATKKAAAVPPPLETRRPRIFTWVLAIDAVGLLIGGVVAEAFAATRYSEADRTCSPRCSDSVVSGIATASDFGLGLLSAAGVAAVGAIIAFVAEGRGERTPRVAALGQRLTVSF